MTIVVTSPAHLQRPAVPAVSPTALAAEVAGKPVVAIKADKGFPLRAHAPRASPQT